MSSDRHRPRKRFGQNFLQDIRIIDRILQTFNPSADAHIVEIGPGLGALTKGLLEIGQSLDVIEIDRDLAATLEQKYSRHPGFTLHNQDVLTFDFASLNKTPLSVIGNLPYNISTPLLFHLLDYRHLIRHMTFMLQKEVVDRMAASPGEKAWGRLGIMVQYFCDVEKQFNVPPGAFYPPPKVESAIVRLTPREDTSIQALDSKILDQVVRTAFNQRRKAVRNSLKTLLSLEDYSKLEIDPGLRPEALSLEDYVRISNFLYQQRQQQ